MDVTYPCGRSEIEAVLPHRDPFLWLTRVVECDPGKSVKAELEVSPELPLFKGHFPEYPVLPGGIIMEALAQAASFCLLVEDADSDTTTLGFFAGIDGAKFRRQVRPGDVITLEANIVKARHRLCVAEVTASVDGAVCATATQKYMLAPADTLDEATS